jgi:ribosomal protein L22
MTPDTPGDPQKGRPAEAEQAEAQAAEAKEAAGQERAAEAAEAAPQGPPGEDISEEAVAETGVEPETAPQAEGTAAAQTGVGKDVAEAALREGAQEPVADDQAPTAEDVPAERAEPAEAPAQAAAVQEEAPEEAAEARAAERRGRRGLRRRRAEEPAAEPAPRRQPQRARADGRVLVRAQAKYVRTSARKARLVCDHIRGKSVEEARAILAHTPRAVARDWSKLLESAVANAEHNHELVGEDLYIKAVHADEGPTIRRFRPRAMGRATRIRKRTSHLTILLTPKQ